MTRPAPRPEPTSFGRRRFFAIGGTSIALATLVAACGDDNNTGIARVGSAPSTTKLPDSVVNDAVLLRTAASIERSIIAVYQNLMGKTDLLAAEHQDAIMRFHEDHMAHADAIDKLTTSAGGTAWSNCGNPRFDKVIITPIWRAITGAEKTDLLPATPPSDDAKRDVLNFAHALETLAGEMYQALVAQLNDPALRQQAIHLAITEVRHAAVLAIAITGRPAGYVDPSDVAKATLVPATTAAPATTQNIAAPETTAGGEAAPAATPIPTVYAMPSTFGPLGQIQLVVGKPNENGTRLTTNLETPSLNTYAYDFTSCATAG